MKKLLTLCLLVATAACAGGTGQDDGVTPAGDAQPAQAGAIPDDQIGLSKVSVFDVPSPDPVAENALMPGEGAVQERAYDLAPPVISHAVADFLPITTEDNACIVCHAVSERVEGEATPIPASHYTDLRNAPDQVGDEVAGARYDCTLCHAPMTGANELVANEFKSQ